MSCLANFLWIILGGFFMGLGWALAGILWCLTIVGIPIGKQCFKFAKLAFSPFGKEVEYGNSTGSVLLNIIWLFISGLPLALDCAICGLIYCVTIIGIPFGKQCFKFAKLALMPFGASVK